MNLIPECAICHNLCDEVLCSRCRELLVSELKFDDYHGIHVAGYYRNCLKELIERYKFGGDRRLAGIFAAMIDHMIGKFAERAVIVYVPCTFRNRMRRGFDQCRLICRYSRYEYLNVLVNRTHGSQKKKNRLQRKDIVIEENSNLYLLDRYRDMGYTVVLVDDVYTTGATIAAARRIVGECRVCTICATVDAVKVKSY